MSLQLASWAELYSTTLALLVFSPLCDDKWVFKWLVRLNELSHYLHWHFHFSISVTFCLQMQIQKHQLNDISHHLHHSVFAHCALIYDCSNDQLDWMKMHIICMFLFCSIVCWYMIDSLNGQLDWMKGTWLTLKLTKFSFPLCFIKWILRWPVQLRK